VHGFHGKKWTGLIAELFFRQELHGDFTALLATYTVKHVFLSDVVDKAKPVPDRKL
jgi:hypothetical protein